jgi:xyloglucan-specific exo-beta-1,4-glucanase
VNIRARLLGLLCCVVAAGASAAVPSVPYEWRNVVIGGGGFSPDIVFSPAEKGLAYLRTDVGGAYRWDDRLQRWIPLQDALWQSNYFGIESVAPDPKHANTVYLAAGMYSRDPAAILRSADRGATWAITPVPFAMGGNEDGGGLGERLAVDPNRTSTLFFGSRHDGLWRSDDSAKSWRKVAGFPYAGLGAPAPRSTHGGLSFVVFAPHSRNVFAGVADPGAQHLFRSTDGGETWSAIAGGPAPTMLPVKAAIDPNGVLYVDYCTGIGPNGIGNGAVWKLDTRSGAWTDISPVRGADAEGGYMGLSVDPQRPGRVAVSTVDRWSRRDTVWLSNDGGARWTNLRVHSTRDFSAAPFLSVAPEDVAFGHWIAGLAFDPFDGGTLAYTTGDTVYRTGDALKPALSWKPWVKGIEETVPLSLASPTGGAPLISGIGDVRGFVHDALDAPPPRWLAHPDLPNTNNVDYAGLAPNVVVRSASNYEPLPDGISLSWSEDGGQRWHELKGPAVKFEGEAEARIDTNGEAPITVSADGRTFAVSGPVLLLTADRGRTWWKASGLPQGVRAIADKADANTWYALDYDAGKVFVSRDGAHSFAAVPTKGLPEDIADVRPRSRETPSFLVARPGTAGELWLLTGGRLYRSTDFARSFSVMTSPDITFAMFGLGKAAPGATAPALYAFGVKPTFGGLWRSIDGGAKWVRINDEAHQWGLRFRTMTGDPRTFGRVYVATDGRGILYGDPEPR